MPVAAAVPLDADTASVVLDTNTLLDLLLFGDARAQPLHLALRAGRLRALATEEMFGELGDVLTRPFVANWPVAAGDVMQQARGLCRIVDGLPASTPPAPRCSDADDQPFIDLAWGWPTDWLISRDRALLALARPSLARGLRITTPVGWAAAMASG